MSKHFKTLVALLLAMFCTSGFAGNDTMPEQAKEAWQVGRIESAFLLNSHLSAFEIDTQVDQNTVTLNGKVNTQTEKELAGEIAEGIDGIKTVNNELQVEKSYKQEGRKNDSDEGFIATIKDATKTAEIKMQLAASEVKARDINVDTENMYVTLTGVVDNEAEKELTEQIIKNTDDITGVKNQLVVNK